MKERRALIRAHSSGWRDSISARSPASAIATVSSQFAVQPARIPVGMMSLWSTIPLAIGSLEPGRIGESSHSSTWIRWPGLSEEENDSPASNSLISAKISPPGVPSRNDAYQLAIARQ